MHVPLSSGDECVYEDYYTGLSTGCQKCHRMELTYGKSNIAEACQLQAEDGSTCLCGDGSSQCGCAQCQTVCMCGNGPAHTGSECPVDGAQGCKSCTTVNTMHVPISTGDQCVYEDYYTSLSTGCQKCYRMKLTYGLSHIDRACQLTAADGSGGICRDGSRQYGCSSCSDS